MEGLKELLVPSNACLLAIALGLVTRPARQWRRVSDRCLVAGSLLLVVLASGWTAALLLGPLERASRAAAAPDPGGPAVIVVLGAHGEIVPDVPASSWPNAPALHRVVEAVRLHGACPRCSVVVTGNANTVEAMSAVLTMLGVPRAALVLDAAADSTAQSARNLAPRLREGPFYLVTSAGHMPRALLAFRAQGLAPLPAPTDFLAPRDLLGASPWPSPRSLWLSDLAVHEYLGILWYRVQGM